MRKFIKHIISFLIFFGVFVAFSFIIFSFLVNKKAKNFVVESNIEKVFIGDSHIQKDINDFYINNAINIGERAEATYYSFYKLKYLLENNSNIKQVYLGFSYHNLSSYYNPFVKGKYSLTTAPKYFYLLPNSKKIALLLENCYHVSFYKSIVKSGIEILKDKRKPYKGGYINKYQNTRVNKKIIDKRISFQYFDSKGSLNGYSDLSIEYLLKIKELCKNNKVDFYIINTPLHHYYKAKVPAKFINKFDALIRENNIKEINGNSEDYIDSDFIPDGDHLSKEGAIIFSKYLNNQAK